MTETITYVFMAKEEAFAPDATTTPPFSGKQNVTIETDYNGEKFELSGLTATVAGSTDDEYATALFNAMQGLIYVHYGLSDPQQT